MLDVARPSLKHNIVKALQLLWNRKWDLLAFEMTKRVPGSLFLYNKFYIVHCDRPRNLGVMRRLGSDYIMRTEEFSYELLDRIQKELPQNLETVYYRARGRERKTKSLYIEYCNKIIADCFILIDNEIPSPSGYVLNMKQKKVTSCYGIFVEPRHRMRGLFLNLIKAAYDLSVENDAPGLYGEIHFLNRLSLLSHIRAGFKVYRHVNYIRIRNRVFFFESKKASKNDKSYVNDY